MDSISWPLDNILSRFFLEIEKTFEFWQVIEGTRVKQIQKLCAISQRKSRYPGEHDLICYFVSTVQSVTNYRSDLWPFNRRSATMQLEIYPKGCKSTFPIDIFIWSAVRRQKPLGKRPLWELWKLWTKWQWENLMATILRCQEKSKLAYRTWCKLHWGFGNGSKNYIILFLTGRVTQVYTPL